METFVRGRTIEAIQAANAKVDRALRAGAMAIRATVEITTLPGYMPTFYDDNLVELMRDNAEELLGPGALRSGDRTGRGRRTWGTSPRLCPSCNRTSPGQLESDMALIIGLPTTSRR